MAKTSLMEAVRSYVEDIALKKITEEEERKNYNEYFHEILDEAIKLFNEEYYSTFYVGDKVKKSVENPRQGWPSMENSQSVGVIRKIEANNVNINLQTGTCWWIYRSELKVVEKVYEPFKDFKIPELNSIEEYESFKQKTLENILYICHDEKIAKKAHNMFSKKLEYAEKNKVIGKQTQETLNEEPKTKLEIDAKGKPRIELTPLEKTVVNTKTQKAYDTLMQVYEIGGWTWSGGDLPTSKNYLGDKEDICMNAGEYEPGKERNFMYADKKFYKYENWKIISDTEFYSIQEISDENLKEINEYFENKHPNRKSKGY